MSCCHGSSNCPGDRDPTCPMPSVGLAGQDYMERGVYSEALRIHHSQASRQAWRGPPEEARDQESTMISTIPATSFQCAATALKGLSNPLDSDTAPVEPKVIASKDHRPAKAPRQVLVERKRRVFEALDIEQLLAERGINYADPCFGAKSWLPLEPFDDTTFDDRSPKEWMALSKGPDGSFLPLAGKGLFQPPYGGYKWEPCRVLAYDEKSNMFEVQWQHTCQDEVQRKRVMEKALSSPRMRLYKQPTVDFLLKEVNTCFARTMNKIAFDMFMGRNTDKRLHMDLQLPSPTKPRAVAWCALVHVPRYDFCRAFASFCSSSLYVKKEVIQALVSIRGECVDMLNKRIFNTSFSKALKLDEYRQTQRVSISQVTYFLQEAWATKLHEIIETNLRHVGKGWFNIHHFNKETYEYGKVKRMLILTRLLMRDALREMTTRSINDFVELFRTSTPKTVNIMSLSKVQNIYEETKVQSLDRELSWNGLFLLEIVPSPDGSQFMLTPQPEGFSEATDELITRMGDIPHPETIVLPHLFKSQQKHIAMPITLDESLVQDSKKTILRLIESHTPYLQLFLDQFHPFVDVLCLSLTDVVEETEQRATTEDVAEAFRHAIHSFHERSRQIDDEIPNSVSVGVFRVSCEEIRGNLKSILRGASQLLLDALAKRFREQCNQTLEEFMRISTTLLRRPGGIEELTELREYMDDIPTKLEDLAIKIKSALHIFEVLEAFKYRLLVEDYNLRWRLYGSPAHILELMNEASAAFIKDRARFLDEMLVQQCEFSATITDVADVVASFATFTDTSKLAEANDSVLAVSERLETSIQQAKLFNHRERLFGREVTDYSSLAKLQKVCGGIKALRRVEKIFQERSLPAVFEKASEITTELNGFKPLVPIIVSLRNDGMRERHWNRLFERIGKPQLHDGSTLTLNSLLAKGVADCTEFVVELGELAEKESYLEKALQAMKAEWGQVVFEFKEKYKDTDTYILKGTDEIVALLDEHILTTQGLQFSIYKKPLEREIDEWANLIMNASETLDEWLKCQRGWLYLQPIFNSPDIAKQLPAETKRFFTVDTAWRVLMRHTYEEPQVLPACSTPGLVEKLRENNRLMERVQKELESYLELKRSQFARFYFLSNDELLEILSETTDPLKVQPFLCKVFENMNNLEFSEDLVATAMLSAEGERMAFVKGLVTCGKSVEIWMKGLEQTMKLSVRESLHASIREYPTTERTSWVTQHAGQCVLNGSQVHWTAMVEDAIQNGQLKNLLKAQTSQLLDLVSLLRKGLSTMQSITIGALIVIDVHAKDIVQRLWKEEVSSVEAFEWIAQLRYYWRDDNCWTQCVQTDFPYGYEYLGNTFRLVITPLTDMAYMTLMGAQQLNLGGSLAGPAGTGKTETTKDLAKALATQCVVFNCSEMMDFIMIAKFFKGLASSGAWCCFDEFNRINIEVLSVIAQQLIVLFGAKAQLLSYQSTLEVDFEDSQILVQPTFNVFITMNPGYAGRTELPDNLKCLFRPMAMMVPDYSMIAEIMLYSFGFDQARELATKMVATFKLSSEQLSSQDHYDYGMRAVRSVINAAGVLKRKCKSMDEQQLLLQALRDVNVPKFLSHDLPLFENIVADLFPGVEVPRSDNQLLQEALRLQSEALRLQPIEPFMAKVMQLYDTVQVRHGIMLVGPTGGGKTSSYRLLAAAMTELHKIPGFAQVHLDVLNPKSVTIGQLYGCFNETTHEWTDGLAAALIRQAIRDTTQDQHWIMFDGPVDALWIESMNSVLDDNKKLCLNSGEIIALTNRLVVEDLSVASPATVSRCGMVYMEPDVLGFPPLINSWLKGLPPVFKDEHKTLIDDLCCTFLHNGLCLLRKQCKEIIATVNSNLCMTFLRMLGSVCSRYRQVNSTVNEETVDTLFARIPAAFIFSFIWSFGITANGSGRQVIDQWLRSRVKEHGLDIGTILPDVSLYDVCYEINNHRWTPWVDTVPSFVVPKGAAYENIVVPTLDSIRLAHTFSLLLLNGHPVLCAGPSGTGKSVILTDLLLLTLPENYETHIMTFSAHTRVNQVQDLLEAKLEKRRRGIYGPPAGKTCIFFIDDLNMPRKEEFGAQPPLELLRQWFDHKGWYDRKMLAFQQVVEVGLVAAMGPPGGGRNEISARLMRHYCILAFDELQRASITTIFQTLNRHCFQHFSQDIQALTDSLVCATTDLYSEVTMTLLPTPTKSHYTFNLREVWKVFQGLAPLSPKAVKEPKAVIRCWVHETCRVFCDRLVDDIDREWFHEALHRHIKQAFGIEFASAKEISSLIFADFTEQTSERHYLVCLAAPITSRRQSLSRLAAFIMDTEYFKVESGKGYGMAEWREELKKCFMNSGLEGKVQTLVLCDSEVLGEPMLEDINSALSYGDVPNLYKKEDMEEIMKVFRLYCKQQGINPSRGNIFNAYVKKWPSEALVSVAQIEMEKCEVSVDSQEQVVDVLQAMHRGVQETAASYREQLNRAMYATPTTFLEMLKAFIHLVRSKQVELVTVHERFEKGIGKLEETADQVAEMRAQLQQLQPVLHATSEEVEKTMIQIQKDHALADETKQVVAHDEAVALKKAKETQALKDDAQRDLDEALPALEEAVECVKKLKSDHIREVKALTKPPSGVILTMEAVCIMFGVLPVKKPDPFKPGVKIEDYWESAQHRLLKDPKKLLEDLLKYDKSNSKSIASPKPSLWFQQDNIPDSIIATISPYIDRSDFDPAAIRKASVACEAICMWVRAMFKYYNVAKTVAPKRVKLRQAEEELRATIENLEKTKARLKEVEDKIERLAADFALAVDRKEQLTIDIQSCKKKLERAEPLLVGLADEKHRWGEQARLSKDNFRYISGHSLISAGMLTYAGPFTAAYRGELNTQWSQRLLLNHLPFKPTCGLQQFLETLDPSLDPILLQQRAKSGSGYTIMLGDKPIPWGPTFKLFLTTKLPNPKFPVDTFVKTTVVNFAITQEGLEDQMLGLVVTKEAPQLEERKAALAQSSADMRRELKGIQDKILQVISQSQGNILDDEVLLTTLAASKQTSEEIQEKVREAELTEHEIDEARQCYRKVASRCSQLFFSLVELACIEPMYQYSQQWFQNLVSVGLSEASPTSNVEQRTLSLVEHISYLVYQNVSRSLFVRHKLLFAFALSLRVQAKTPVDPAELRFLLTGTITGAGSEENPISWLTDKQWQAICELSHLPAFNGLAASFHANEEGFQRVFDSPQADQEPLPGRWQSLNPIQKMCILRILRMDSLTAAASSYVAMELGARFLEPPPFNLSQCYKDSTPQTPLIFILSQGSDPVSELLSFAKEMKMSRRFESISLGQGQGPKAAKLIEDGCSRGGWVLLQNCHLAASWMNELERICAQWNPEEIHRDFRLWLTSMPSSSFPVSVLQNGVKMTNEPPKGLKANLQRLYSSIDNRQLKATQKPSQFRKLLFAFCFFHAIVQERRRFGPIGWNIPYEFTQDDLVVCQRQLKIFLDVNEKIPYKVLRFLGAHINYGGRVTDANDKRLIDAILSTYVNERLISEGEAFKFSRSGIYYCPDEEDIEGFNKYIQSLPPNAQPEVFGLHENANINCAKMEGKELLDGILSMVPQSRSAGSSCPESTVSDLAAYVQSLLPEPFDVESVEERYPTRYEESMNTLVVQESIRYNGLLAVINKTMNDLRLALKGRIVMTEELEMVSEALFNNQAFLTGVLQNYARKYRVAVDRLSFAFIVLKNTDELSLEARDGCLVHGIFLEGCRWDAELGTLAPSRPKVLFEELPVLWFLPQKDRVPESASVYMCPLYKVPSRKGTLSTTGHSTNYITSIELPCVGSPDVPVKAGVAALLSLQD
ncbi:dynein heavy chain related protein [Cyclospora cayetanensis]|uniref:Dynein heavy chain related protein n=1 Tax=Cyclospora cayetanensis TaxID=88456 RepID=A0A1D3CT61_9EIME|nr:dynein heavy chain related protein [Cyclospora cayetanensis]